MKFRPAEIADCMTILAIRNKVEVREVSFNTDVISEEAHRAWFAQKMGEISVVESDGQVVGVVRLASDGEVSLYVDPPFFGKGIGTLLLEKTIAGIRSGILTARIRQDNEVSKTLFAKMGFVEEGDKWIREL